MRPGGQVLVLDPILSERTGLFTFPTRYDFSQNMNAATQHESFPDAVFVPQP